MCIRDRSTTSRVVVVLSILHTFRSPTATLSIIYLFFHHRSIIPLSLPPSIHNSIAPSLPLSIAPFVYHSATSEAAHAQTLPPRGEEHGKTTNHHSHDDHEQSPRRRRGGICSVRNSIPDGRLPSQRAGGPEHPSSRLRHDRSRTRALPLENALCLSLIHI